MSPWTWTNGPGTCKNDPGRVAKLSLTSVTPMLKLGGRRKMLESMDLDQWKKMILGHEKCSLDVEKCSQDREK